MPLSKKTAPLCTPLQDTGYLIRLQPGQSSILIQIIGLGNKLFIILKINV
jgi:hypothetical protein